LGSRPGGGSTCDLAARRPGRPLAGGASIVDRLDRALLASVRGALDDDHDRLHVPLDPGPDRLALAAGARGSELRIWPGHGVLRRGGRLLAVLALWAYPGTDARL